MRPTWPKLASLAKKNCILYTFRSSVYSLLPRDNLFKIIFSVKLIEYVTIISILHKDRNSLSSPFLGLC